MGNPDPDFREIFQALPAAYLVLTPEVPYAIVAVTDAYLAATMSDREHLVGRDMYELFPDDLTDFEATGATRLADVLRRVTQSHAAASMPVARYDLRQPGGGFLERWWSSTVTPLIDSKGGLEGLILAIEDVTASVPEDAGQLLRGTTHELESRREHDRQREEWASIVAHDLKQPANVIRLACDMLEAGKHKFSPSEQKSLRWIRNGVVSLTRMIDDLLDASLVDAQRLTLEPRKFDLAALVEQTVEQLAGGGARYQVHVAPGTVRQVWADPERVEQVLRNLLSNAVKYGNPEAPIEIALVGRDDEIETIVANRGEGIAEQDLPEVFSRFWRSSRYQSGRVRGLGLGLYVCKGLTEAQHGHIWVDSTPGGLTRFHFTLPTAEGAVAEPPAAIH